MKLMNNQTLRVECPACHFGNYVFFRQIQFEGVVVCRGCNANIKLTYLGAIEIALRRINESTDPLPTIAKISIIL
jgi:hypothetical protein